MTCTSCLMVEVEVSQVRLMPATRRGRALDRRLQTPWTGGPNCEIEGTHICGRGGPCLELQSYSESPLHWGAIVIWTSHWCLETGVQMCRWPRHANVREFASAGWCVFRVLLGVTSGSMCVCAA
jgi:hypothetical protein